MKFTGIFLFIFYLTPIVTAVGHPVSFKNSKGIMGYHSSKLSHNQISYSFRHWIATGIHHIRRIDSLNAKGSFVSVNFLVNRWNASNLQANIYTILGVGTSNFANSTESTTGMSAFQFDIEDRDYYFLAKYLRTFDSDQTTFEQSTIRIGFSPYVEEFDGIHSWLILEWQNTDFIDENGTFELTPFLRVFYKNLLFEIGMSFDGVTKFNYITHF